MFRCGPIKRDFFLDGSNQRNFIWGRMGDFGWAPLTSAHLPAWRKAWSRPDQMFSFFEISKFNW